MASGSRFRIIEIAMLVLSQAIVAGWFAGVRPMHQPVLGEQENRPEGRCHDSRNRLLSPAQFGNGGADRARQARRVVENLGEMVVEQIEHCRPGHHA